MSPIQVRLVLPLHRISGDVFVQGLLFAATGLFATMLLVGYRTRLASTLSWVMLFSLHDRNPLVISGGDYLLRYALFWSMFVPLGERWSLDRLRTHRGTPQSAADQAETPLVSWGVAALFAQIASIYLFAGILKLESPTWRNGTALQSALQMYTRATPLGTSLLNYPRFLEAVTYCVPLFQIVGVGLLFSPIWPGPMRTLTVFGFMALQAGIGSGMMLGNFQYVAVLLMLPMLPGWFWDRIVFQWWRRETEAPRISGGLESDGKATERGKLRRFLSSVSEATAAVLAVYTLLMNVGSLFGDELPGRPQRLAYVLGIDQSWDLFSLPAIDRPFGWVVAPATLEDGRVVDLLTGQTDIAWERLEFSPVRLIYWRWRTYQSHFADFSPEDPRRPDYPSYLCRSWNASHPQGERVRSLRIVFVRDVLHADGTFQGPKPITLWEGTCTDGAPMVEGRQRP